MMSTPGLTPDITQGISGQYRSRSPPTCTMNDLAWLYTGGILSLSLSVSPYIIVE